MATTISHQSSMLHRISKYSNLLDIDPTDDNVFIHSVAVSCAVAGSALTVYTVPQGKTLLINSINHAVYNDFSTIYDNIGNSATGNNPITLWEGANGSNINFDYPIIFERGITLNAATCAVGEQAGFIFKGVLV